MKVTTVIQPAKHLGLLPSCWEPTSAAYFQISDREPNSHLEFLIKNKIKGKCNYYMVWLFKNYSPKREKKLTLLSCCRR